MRRRTGDARQSREPRVIAYTRISSEEGRVSGAGLDAQREAISREVGARGWTSVQWVEDGGFSGATLDRPGIQAALTVLCAGEADILVVSKLDRLSRSLLDFVGLLDLSRRNRFAMVALDARIDTTTPEGAMLSHVLMTFAEFERRLIGQRTKAALAVKKANGVRLGRPVRMEPAVQHRIEAERIAGRTFEAIAISLTADRIPTANGGRWHRATVRKVLATIENDRLAAGKGFAA